MKLIEKECNYGNCNLKELHLSCEADWVVENLIQYFCIYQLIYMQLCLSWNFVSRRANIIFSLKHKIKNPQETEVYSLPF